MLHEHLCDGSLHNKRGPVALLERQRRRDSEADAWPRFSELLPAQPACASGPHALRKHLVHNVKRRRRALRRGRGLRCLRGRGRRRRTHVDMDDSRGRMQGDRDRLTAVEYSSDRAHILLQRAQDRRRVPKDVDALRGGDGEERRDRGGENKRGALNALVIHDDTRARAESAR